jgi:hypothetical protein
VPYLNQPDSHAHKVYYQCDYCQNLGSRAIKEYNRNIKEKSGPLRYCSSKCSILYRKLNKLKQLNCKECGEIFIPDNSSRKFCSRNCSGLSSNRNRSIEFRLKQSVSIKTSEKAINSHVNRSENFRAAYEENPKFCIICNLPKPWSKRFTKTCGSSACIKKSIGSPEQRAKISTARKKRFANGSLKVTGGNTKWLTYKNFKVQGSFEYRTCIILDQTVENGKIAKWEYTNDRVPYINSKGKSATYLLDFKVWDNDGRIYYIETKGYIREDDELKWSAARSLGLILEVWFENDIVAHEAMLAST